MKTNKAPTKKDLRLFTVIITSGFFILFWVIPFYKNHTSNTMVLWIIFPFLFMGLIFPELMIRPRHWWLKLGEILGLINGFVLFTVLYYSLFLFLSLIFKIFNRDPLKLKFKNYSTLKNSKEAISSFENMF